MLPEEVQRIAAALGSAVVATRTAWEKLCAAHAPALTAIDHYARLVHSDINPKNILVSHTRGGWRIEGVPETQFTLSQRDVRPDLPTQRHAHSTAARESQAS